DPGTFGDCQANMDCVGHYYQWGKPYDQNNALIDREKGTTEVDNDWVFPDGDWDICPEGYRLPTVLEYKKMCDRIVSTDFYAENYTKAAKNMPDGKTRADFLTSFLRLPLGGWNNTASSHANPGMPGAYWTADRAANNVTPIPFVILGREGVNFPTNYTVISRAQVRCVRDL
ncbi:MAG: FISUMP domain-containing protein, partial [Candidatus Cryptobacteroides sp.]